MARRAWSAWALNSLLAALLSAVLSTAEGAEWPEIAMTADLRDLMYTSLPMGTNTGHCFRMENATHELGCSGWTGARGLPLVSYDSLTAAEELLNGGEMVLLVPVLQLTLLVTQLEKSASLAGRVRGVLVTNFTADGTGKPLGLSGAERFPGEAYAPYEAPAYEWNPQGTGLNRKRFGFPVMMLDGPTTEDALRRAADNLNLGYSGAMHMAVVDSTMKGIGPSTQCLVEKTCRPIGGHNVWAALPPLPQAETAPTGLEPASAPVILVTAQMDTDAFFKQLAQGANSPMSGLIALLVAADALWKAGLAEQYSKHIVFAPLAGEPWDFMGSRKFIWDLSKGAETLQPLPKHSLEQVVDLSSVGNTASGVYLHRQLSGGFGDSTKLLEAFQTAADAEGSVAVKQPSASTPGVPPSSLMNFLRYQPQIKGVVVTDFHSQFSNSYYQSFLDSSDSNLFGDQPSGINTTGVAGVGVLVARALHILAAVGGPAEGSVLEVNETRAEELTGQLEQCLLVRSPGLACNLVTDLMTVHQTYNPLPHYLGVQYTLTKDPQDPQPYVKNNMERFLWNFLATRTGTNQTSRCEPDFPYYGAKDVCPAAQICVGWRPGYADGQGWCYAAAVKYAPSYSTRLLCSGCDVTRMEGYKGTWKVQEDDAEWRQANGDWPEDPLWAESNWDSGIPSVSMHLQEPMSLQWAIFAAGVVLTLATAASVWVADRTYEKHAKRQ